MVCGSRADGREDAVGGSLDFGEDASYQNTAEFVAAVLSVRGIRHLAADCKTIMLKGDSTSALTWADTK